MKTAISVPDRIFDRVELKARELGISRSEFFASAAERWLDLLDDQGTTHQIDAVLADPTIQDDNRDFRWAAARNVLDGGDAW